MKKTILILLVVLSSCTTTKKVTENTKNTASVERSSVSADSINVTVISQAIDESFLLPLKTQNKQIDSLLKATLKGFTATKKSGNNSYSAKFDYDKLALIIESKVGASTNNKSSTSKSENINKSFESEVDTYLYKKVIALPYWVYILAAIYFLPKIVNIANTVINPIQRLYKKITLGYKNKSQIT